MRINGLTGTQFTNSFAAIACRTGTGLIWMIDGSFYFTMVGAAAIADKGQMRLNHTLASGIPTEVPALAFPGAPAAFDSGALWTLVVTAQWSAASALNIARTLTGSLERICH